MGGCLIGSMQIDIFRCGKKTWKLAFMLKLSFTNFDVCFDVDTFVESVNHLIMCLEISQRKCAG